MATIRSVYFGRALEPILGEVFKNVYDELPSMIPELFTMRKTDKPYEDDQAIGGMSVMRKFTDVVQYDRPYQGYTITYRFPEYAGGVQVERRFFDDQMIDVIKSRPAELAQSAHYRRELDAAMIFNFADQATAVDAEGVVVPAVGGDGEPLCSAVHPSSSVVQGADGPAARSNIDNLPLNHDNLQTIKNRMRAYVDDRGNRRALVPDTILVAPGNEEMAWELITAEGRIFTADNNPNIHQGRYKLLVWDYLEDDGRWFMIDSRYMKRFLKWYDRIPLEFAMEEEFDRLIAKYRAYGRWAVGFSDWMWVYGCFP